MIEINGSIGGGQILRTSLSLSMVTQKPFRIINIRKNRSNPGLQHQHLTAVNSAQKICNADVKGDVLHSTSLEFLPNKIIPGNYEFDIGTAGSTTLVLQTILPALMQANKESIITITGGTENPMAPPSYDFKHLFLDQLKHLGIQTELEIIKHGYYPKGGGKLILKIQPLKEIKEINITEAKKLENAGKSTDFRHAENQKGFHQVDVHIESSTSLQKARVSERILEGFQKHFKINYAIHEHLLYSESLSPGCYIHCHIHYEKAKPGITILGERNKKAEDVGKEAAIKLQELINSKAPVDEHTADQLLIYMALKGSGKLLTNKITEHTLVNIKIIEKFLDVRFEIKDNLIICTSQSRQAQQA